MTEGYSLNDSMTDAVISDFFKRNEDLKLTIKIDWIDDLGIRVMMVSEDDPIARSGSTSPSVTEALMKLIPKAEDKIAKHREFKAQLERAFADDLEDDDE